MNSGAKNTMTLGGLGLVIGAVLPWADVFSFFGEQSITGLEGDGIISGALGVVLLLVGLLYSGRPGKLYSPIGSLLALFAGYVVVTALINIFPLTRELGESVFTAIGSGLYVSLLGAFLALIAGLQRVPGESAPALATEGGDVTK